MLGLSIMQPWASLIAGGDLSPGVKPIENRTWKPPARLIGQRFAIHASKKLDVEAFHAIKMREIEIHRHEIPFATPKEFPTSAVIGLATIVRVFEGNPGWLAPRVFPAGMPKDCERWYVGPIGFELREVVRLATPVPCKGALSFWRVPDDVELAVRAQLGDRGAA